MKFKDGIIFIMKIIGTVLLGIIIGFGLLCAVYLLPTGAMEVNVKESAEIFKTEEVYKYLDDRYETTVLDNFTDAVMLSECIAKNAEDSFVKAALNGTYLSAKRGNPADALTAYGDGAEEKYENRDYARYWHGYVCILKVLLIFFNYGQIRVINGIFLLLVTVAAVRSLAKTVTPKYAFAYVCMIITLAPNVFPYSFQNSTIYYITSLSVIVLCRQADKIKLYQKETLLSFVLIGIMTSFFDFLTYPSLTIGISLVLVVILHLESPVVKTITYMMKAGICWCVGYIGMWAGKWVLATIVLGRNVLAEAAESIAIRTGNTYENYFMGIPYTMNIYWYEKVQIPFSVILTKPTLLMTLTIIAVSFVLMVVCRKEPLHRKKNLFLFGLVALIPQAWFCVIQNHSYVHCFFTFRAFGTFFFAMFAFCMSVFRIKKKNIILKETKNEKG